MAARFRTSYTQVAGQEPAKIVQCRVINVNVVNWTVDVVSKFDRHTYFDIQVGSPYLHYSAGEGVWALPEVGAVCQVCIPSDSSPPFVLAFVMPHEVLEGGTEEAPAGTRSHGAPAKNVTDASFAGGRPRSKPGDISFRTRDGNFITLHRGGVLQIGANEAAQRIYIPLGNLVTDIAENYAMHSAGGSILWGLQEGPSLQKYPSQYVQTFRVFADDKFADIRVAVGKVYTPTPEPDGGTSLADAGVGQSSDSPIVYEITVSPKGFNAESGEVADASTGKQSVLKFTFDRSGNVFFRASGNLGMRVGRKLTLKVTEQLELQTDASASIRASKGIDIDGGTYTHVKGQIVRLGQGTTPVARLQDLVNVPVAAWPVTLVFATPPIPGTPCAAVLTGGAPGLPVGLVGFITSANSKVLA